MKKTFLYLLVLIMIGILSCKKFLNKKSDASLVTPSTLADAQALLDDADIMNILATPAYMEASADDYFLLPATYHKFNQAFLNYYTWQPQEYNFGNDWSSAYLAVYNANLCLDRLSVLSPLSQQRDQYKRVKGGGLFFRAYYFTDLLWNYAKAYDANTATKDFGIVLRLNADFNSPSIRSNVADSYQQAIMDAKMAASLLPDYSVHPLRPSKAAAFGLLARINLSMRHYDQAYLYADSCLALNHELLDYNEPADLNGSVMNDVPFNQFNKETIFYTELTNNIGIFVPSRAKIDTILYDSYDDDDLRKQAFFKSNSGYFQYKGSYTGSPYSFFSGIAVDEILLIHAECLARAGKINQAMQDLNTLLKKRWDKSVSYTIRTALNSQDALSQILKERRKELLMRGLRWIDIKRLNKEGAEITPKRIVDGKEFVLAPNDPFYALPLPTDIIRLTGVPQN